MSEKPAIDDIKKMEDRKDVSGLIAALGRADTNITDLVLIALRKIGDKRAVEPILRYVRESDEIKMGFAGHALKDIGDGAAFHVLLAWLSEDDVRLKKKVMWALRSFEDPDATIPIARELMHPDPSVRSTAAFALGDLKDPRSLPALLGVLNDSVGEVRENAARAICTISTQDDVDILVLATRRLFCVKQETAVDIFKKAILYAGNGPVIDTLSSADGTIQKAAAMALGYPGNSEAIAPLTALLKDPDPEVRAAAVASLGKIDGPGMLEPLSGLLNDTYGDVAIRALGDITDDRIAGLIGKFIDSDFYLEKVTTIEALRKLGTGTAISYILIILEDRDLYVLQHALKCLKNASDKRLVGPLVKIIEDTIAGNFYWDDNDVYFEYFLSYEEDIIMPAIDILANTGDPTAAAPLISLLKNPDPGIRAKVAGALGRLGSAGSAKYLAEALNDCEGLVRIAACQALSSYRDDDEAVKAIIGCFYDPETDVRIAAIDAAADMGRSEALVPLLEALVDTSIGIRWHAARALGKLGDSRATKPLIKMLYDRDIDVRPAAAIALGGIGGIDAVDALIGMSNSEDSALRRYAIDALGEIGGEKAASALSRMLPSKRGADAWRVICALGRAAGPSIRAAGPSIRAAGPSTEQKMLRLLRSRDANVRLNAVMVLGRIGGPVSLWPLEPLLDDKNEKVVAAATRAIEKVRERSR